MNKKAEKEFQASVHTFLKELSPSLADEYEEAVGKMKAKHFQVNIFNVFNQVMNSRLGKRVKNVCGKMETLEERELINRLKRATVPFEETPATSLKTQLDALIDDPSLQDLTIVEEASDLGDLRHILVRFNLKSKEDKQRSDNNQSDNMSTSQDTTTINIQPSISRYSSCNIEHSSSPNDLPFPVPSPFSPMSSYDAMSTPQLQEAMGKIGAQIQSKPRMRKLLKHVYHQTHQYETDSDIGHSPMKLPCMPPDTPMSISNVVDINAARSKYIDTDVLCYEESDGLKHGLSSKSKDLETSLFENKSDNRKPLTVEPVSMPDPFSDEDDLLLLINC